MRYHRVKKIYMGCLSVRKPIVEDCIMANEPLCLLYGDRKMTLSVERLETRPQIHTLRFNSNYNSKPYGLYDFKYEPDPLVPEPDLFKEA